MRLAAGIPVRSSYRYTRARINRVPSGVLFFPFSLSPFPFSFFLRLYEIKRACGSFRGEHRGGRL